MNCALGGRTALVFSAFLAAIAAPAAASPLFWSHADVLAAVQPNNPASQFPAPVIDTDDTGQIAATDSGVATATTAANLASAFGTAWVENGTLHAFATGTGSSLFLPNLDLGGVASSRASFFDTIIPVSSTLPYGTPVTISFASQLNYAITGNGCTDLAIVRSSTSVTGAITPGNISTFSDSTCNNLDFSFSSLTAQAFIGQEFTLQLSLSATARGSVRTASADAGNSLRLFMTPLGDFSLSSASGLDYSRDPAAVPEPTSLALLGIGLIAIAMRRRRSPAQAE